MKGTKWTICGVVIAWLTCLGFGLTGYTAGYTDGKEIGKAEGNTTTIYAPVGVDSDILRDAGYYDEYDEDTFERELVEQL